MNVTGPYSVTSGFLCEEKKKAYFYAKYQLVNPYFFLNHVH